MAGENGAGLTGTVSAEREVPATPDGDAERAPVSTASRIGTLDFIRGLAVMLILGANIVAFGQPFNAAIYPEAFLTEHGEASEWMWVAQYVLVDGKMRGLFTLLFGAGLYLFMERAWARGETRKLQAKRLLILLAFGLIHFFFIWRGDILSYYGMLGLLVLACLKWERKTQLGTGIVTYLIGAVLFALMMVFPYLVADTPLGESAKFAPMRADLQLGVNEALADDAAVTAFKQAGDYIGYVGYRFSEHWYEPFANVMFMGMETFPLMLLGVALYRYGFFTGEIDQTKMKRWGWIGLLAGGLLSLLVALWVKDGGLTFYGTLAAFIGMSPLPRVMMVLGLAALLVAYSPNWTGWLGQRISAAGRAAFTNYLGTSILMLFVFHGWALGLFGELNRPQLYLVMVATWIIMLAWSKPWLERYRYGPLEWLWRCLTYGKLFPMKR